MVINMNAIKLLFGFSTELQSSVCSEEKLDYLYVYSSSQVEPYLHRFKQVPSRFSCLISVVTFYIEEWMALFSHLNISLLHQSLHK